MQIILRQYIYYDNALNIQPECNAKGKTAKQYRHVVNENKDKS